MPKFDGRTARLVEGRKSIDPNALTGYLPRPGKVLFHFLTVRLFMLINPYMCTCVYIHVVDLLACSYNALQYV